MTSIYYQKYIKYKKKYNLLGGEIRINKDNCEKIYNFIINLLVTIQEYDDDHEMKLSEVNLLYFNNKNLFMNDKHFNLLLLTNINFLLNIKLEFITDIEIKEKLQTMYHKRFYSENKIELNFIDNKLDPKCLKNIKVWYTPFIHEDFWRSDINEFMDEYDRFEVTDQSYFLFWTNLLNISSLLCKIKTCNYYFIKIHDDEKSIPTEETLKELHKNNQLMYLQELNNLNIHITKKSLLHSYPNLKYIFTSINNIDWYNFDYIINLLLNSFNCRYEGSIQLLYLELICFLLDTEVHNTTYNTLLLKQIRTICRKQSISSFLYLSLILPKDYIYARNEYTKFCCSTLNPLYLIDDIPLSIDQIIGHDLDFHQMITRKKNYLYNDEVKITFRKFINFLEELNTNKLENYERLLEVTYNNKYNNYNYFLQYFIKFLDKYKCYNYIEMLKYIHFLFHELMNDKPFTILNLLNSINDLMNGGIFTSNILVNDDLLRLELIIFIYTLEYSPFNIEFNNYIYIYLNNIIKISISKIYIKQFENKELIINSYIDLLKQDNDRIIIKNKKEIQFKLKKE